MSIIKVGNYTPATLSRIGAGAQALGVKYTKDQAITKVVHFVIDKIVPGLGKAEKAHAVTFATNVVNDLLRTGRNVTVKILHEHLKDALPKLLAVTRKIKVPNMSMTTSQRSNNGSQFKRGGGVAIGGTTTMAPVAVSHNITKKSKPRMTNRSDGVVIAHSELIGSILSGSPTSNVTAYRAVGFRANPGISSIFPWLSSVAVNYEKYRFRRLHVSIVPLLSTAFNGRIGIGFDFDSSDASPGNRQEFYALSTHAESMPWQAAGVSVKCDNQFRFTGTHVASDNKLIDLGQVIVMSDSISNGTISAALPVYDLIVEYEVELIEPQQALFTTQTFSNTTNLVAGVSLGLGVDTTDITGPQIVTGTAVTATTITVSLPPGTYLFSTRFGWSSGVATLTVGAPTTGSALKSNTAAGTSFGMSIGSATSNTDFTLVFTVSTVSFLANLTAFNMSFSRVPVAVYNRYISA